MNPKHRRRSVVNWPRAAYSPHTLWSSIHCALYRLNQYTDSCGSLNRAKECQVFSYLGLSFLCDFVEKQVQMGFPRGVNISLQSYSLVQCSLEPTCPYPASRIPKLSKTLPIDGIGFDVTWTSARRPTVYQDLPAGVALRLRGRTRYRVCPHRNGGGCNRGKERSMVVPSSRMGIRHRRLG